MGGKIGVIVVDDEFSSRSIIKHFLFDSSNYEILSDFEDGKSALEWLQNNRADIAICDMNMPKMDGIEFVRETKQIYPDIQFLVISGYNDFNYLRECMVNSVSDYLLKHQLTKDILINCLTDICNKNNIKPEDISVNMQLGQLLQGDNSLNEDYLRKYVTENKINFDFFNIIPLAISPDYNPNASYNTETFRLNAKVVIPDLIKQTLGARYQYLIILTNDGEIIILLSFSNVKSFLYMLSESNSLALRMTQRVGRVLDIGMTVGIGSVCVSMKEALQKSVRLQQLLEDKLYYGGGRIFYLEKSEKIKFRDYQFPTNFRNQLTCEISNMDFDASEAIIHNIFNNIKKMQCSKENIKLVCSQIIDILKAELLKRMNETEFSESKINFGQLNQVEHFENETIRIAKNCIIKLLSNSRHEYSLAVNNTMDFIAVHYSENISLEECAQNVGISYTHLSRTFKKETGVGFVEYLNQFRINKAKSLILQNAYTLRKINLMVGFRNYNYFFKVFKEIEKVTPNEFMSRQKQAK
jgi:YesN/AraC family two-component response regulator